MMRNFLRIGASLVLALGVTGCFGSGEPSPADMLQAMRDNQKFRQGLGFLMLDSGRRDADQAVAEFFERAVVEKSGCATAQGSPGFSCDFRLGQRMPDGKVQQGNPANGRFFKSGNGWAVELK